MFDLRRAKRIFRPERQVNKELKNYYHIDTYRNLSDSSFCLLCVDYQTLELLHSLKEPQRYARWIDDYNGRQVRISKPEDEQFVDRLWAKLQEQLADVVCIDALADVIAERLDIVGINDTLKELLAVQKYKLAAITDGKVRDHYFDPARPDEFAAKLGMTLEELQEEVNIDYDYNPTDGDVGWPNMASLDGVGTRRMVEEVPSVFIFDGWTADMSIADMMADTQYETITNGPIEHIDGAIPMGDMLAGKFDRLDLALRHLVGMFSRNGQITVDLPEEPYIRNPLTGERTPLHQLMLQLGLGAAWPTRTYTNPSVFTTGKPQADDPHSYDPHKAPYYPSYLGKILLESLKSGATSDHLLSAGIPILGMTPAIPATPLNPEIPSRPFYSGTTDIWIPGNDGLGLADMFKLPEDTQYSYSTPLGNVLLEYKDGKVYATFNGQKIKIYPTVDLKPESKYQNNIAQIVNEVFKLDDADPNLRPNIQTHAQILNSLNISGGGGGTAPDLTAIVGGLTGIKNAISALELAGCCDDIQAISTVLTTINGTANKIVEAIKEIELNNINVLNTGETAYINVGDGCCDPPNGAGAGNGTGTGGYTPPSLDEPLPNEQPVPDSDICSWVEYILDVEISIFEWILWAMEWVDSFFGGKAVDMILGLAAKSPQFMGLLVAAGLVNAADGPMEEAVVAALGQLIQQAVQVGIPVMKNLIDVMKASKSFALALFCEGKFEAGDIPNLLDDWIGEILRQLPGVDIREIKKLLELLLKNDEVMRRLKYMPKQLP